MVSNFIQRLVYTSNFDRTWLWLKSFQGAKFPFKMDQDWSIRDQLMITHHRAPTSKWSTGQIQRLVNELQRWLLNVKISIWKINLETCKNWRSIQTCNWPTVYSNTRFVPQSHNLWLIINFFSTSIWIRLQRPSTYQKTAATKSWHYPWSSIL